MPTIYVDESGFTGSDLLSTDQPFFVLSSLRFANSVARLPLTIDDVRFASSHDSPGIQAADVAAGLVGHHMLVANKVVEPIAGFSDVIGGMINEWSISTICPQPRFTAKELEVKESAYPRCLARFRRCSTGDADLTLATSAEFAVRAPTVAGGAFPVS